MFADSIFDDLPQSHSTYGVDLDVLLGGHTGLDAAHLLDSSAIGGSSMVGLVEGGLGASDMAVLDLSAVTGSSTQTPAFLIGASGADTLDADLAMMGQGHGDVAVAAMGIDSLWARDDMASATDSRDLSISLVLHRVASFSMTAPARVGLRMGCAN